jgi:DNA-binding beta-propeller fold protein YncE
MAAGAILRRLNRKANSMKRLNICRALFIAAVAVAGAGGKWTLTEAAAQATAQASSVRSMPMFEAEAGWPKVPAKWKVGDQSSFAVDAQDNVWLLNRPRTLKPEQAAMAAPPVVVFDTAGNFIKAWGGAGSGYEWPEREHGIHIDHKGFVWIGGNSCPENGLPGLKPVTDDQLLKFTQDGKLVMQIGHSNQSKGNADTQNLHRPADVWVHPQTNELYVADGYGNHRVAVFDADTGVFKRMWGAFGNKPADDDHCEVVTPKSFPDGKGPAGFNIVHAIRVANSDGTVYVADRENRRVQVFLPDGTFVKQLIRTDIPFAKDLALSADREQQFLYVGGGKGIVVVDRKTLDVIGTIQPPGIIGTGHHIATDSKGNIYIAQPSQGMQKLTFKGMATAAR